MVNLHLLSIPHTINSNLYSHCAFTGKAYRFPAMMQSGGYNVIEYGNEGSESVANEKVVILESDKFNMLKELYSKEFPNEPANMAGSLFQEYNRLLPGAMMDKVKPGDIICHPFGKVHEHLGTIFPQAFHVETGIGYNHTWAPYRIYESYAWWHYHQGKENRAGNDYEFVIPNYYDLDEWDVNTNVGEYLLYFGRLQDDKGLHIVREVAKHTGLKTIICGNGDPTPYLSPDIPNLVYHPPIHGRERSKLLGGARAILMPTRYTEPFGGSGVEAQLCGTPLISSDFGAFSETNPDANLRCKTLKDWLYAVNETNNAGIRRTTAELARYKYNMLSLAYMYDDAFKQITDLQGKGWYTL